MVVKSKGLPPNPLNSGLGIILICPDFYGPGCFLPRVDGQTQHTTVGVFVEPFTDYQFFFQAKDFYNICFEYAYIFI